MPRLKRRQLGFSALVVALFAPVFLSSGSAAFRPAWLTARIGPFPVSVCYVLALFVVLVLLTWVFSDEAFAETGDQPTDDRP